MEGQVESGKRGGRRKIRRGREGASRGGKRRRRRKIKKGGASLER